MDDFSEDGNGWGEHKRLRTGLRGRPQRGTGGGEMGRNTRGGQKKTGGRSVGENGQHFQMPEGSQG